MISFSISNGTIFGSKVRAFHKNRTFEGKSNLNLGFSHALVLFFARFCVAVPVSVWQRTREVFVFLLLCVQTCPLSCVPLQIEPLDANTHTHTHTHTHTYRITPGRYVLSWQHMQMTTKEREYCLPRVQQGAIYLNVAHERQLFTWNESRFWEIEVSLKVLMSAACF